MLFYFYSYFTKEEQILKLQLRNVESNRVLVKKLNFQKKKNRTN